MKRIFGTMIVPLAAILLWGCASTPMTMKSVVEQGQNRSISSILVITNGELFPESSRKIFFDPAIDQVKKMFAENGVKSWSMELEKKSLNPGQRAFSYAKQLEASHVLFISAAKVASFGPRNSAVEYSKQQRLISSYELSFVLADVSTGRNVWKGDLVSGSDYAGNDEEIRAVREKLQDHLARSGLLPAPRTLGGSLPRE